MPYCSCLPCEAGNFCLPGSNSSSAPCPGLGFDCSSGALKLVAGYWMPSSLLVTNVASLQAHPCNNQEACPGRTIATRAVNESGCATGYSGPVCTSCAANFVAMSNFCARSFGTIVSIVAIACLGLVVIATVALCVAVTVHGECNERAVRCWAFGECSVCSRIV